MVHAPLGHPLPAPPAAPAGPRDRLGLTGFVLGAAALGLALGAALLVAALGAEGAVAAVGLAAFGLAGLVALAGAVLACCAVPRLRRREATNGALTYTGLALSGVALLVSMFGTAATAATWAWRASDAAQAGPAVPAPVEEPAADPSQSPAPQESEPAEPAPPAAEAPAPAAPAPAPAGGEPTPPGAVLPVGGTATIDYAPLQDKPAGRIHLRLDSIDTGTPEDLASFDLGDRALGLVPQYVRFTVTGGPGASNLEFSSLIGKLSGTLPDGSEAAELTVYGKFDLCEQQFFPQGFTEGSTFQTCLVMMANPAAPVSGAMFENYDSPYDRYDGQPVHWRK
ncbi:hypothetical protein [Kineococcus xinjiangensis]|uniref:hypothetical protein n=1 Tax=Kineococcus xinjiangensis TaxID=512762 RepID=UPI0011AFD48B|nr:hypothetical protein [Kineococcus xinjiangensis]